MQRNGQNKEREKADTVLSVRFKVRTFIVSLMNSVLDSCKCFGNLLKRQIQKNGCGMEGDREKSVCAGLPGKVGCTCL